MIKITRKLEIHLNNSLLTNYMTTPPKTKTNQKITIILVLLYLFLPNILCLSFKCQAFAALIKEHCVILLQCLFPARSQKKLIIIDINSAT